MTIRTWRIVKAKHAAAAFTGEGARKHGGRWNSRGGAVIYTSGSTSLAMLEILVHLQSQALLKHYVLFEVVFEESLVAVADAGGLPRTWRKSPPPIATQRIGDAWLASGIWAVLRVPSAVVPNESNYLINPAHKDFGQVKIGARQPAKFDVRLFKK